MPPVPSDETNPLIRTLLADLGIEEGGVELAIDPADEMLGFLVEAHQGDRERALYTYHQSGASIAEAMRQLLRWRFGDPASLGKLLDFASGYGRVTRFLCRLLPAGRIWVSDIYAGGVRFQAERFGVHGIVSTVEPAALPAAVRAAFPPPALPTAPPAAPAEPAVPPVEGTAGRCSAEAPLFDAILVTSLFTHLPEERFVAWLRVLMGLLTPGGLLAFSVHDQRLLAPGLALPASGLLFQEISESGSLDGNEYGSTWVSEEFVRGALRRALSDPDSGPGGPAGGSTAGRGAAGGGSGSLHRLPRGLCHYQDLYVAVPEGGADFSRLRFRGEPYLFVERCALAGGDLLELRGWAANLGSGGLAAVEVRLDGELLARLPVELERPEVAELLGDPRQVHSGWAGSCRLPAAVSRSAAVLALRVVDDEGGAHPELAARLEAALHDSTRLDVTVVMRELRAAMERAARLAAETAALAARIAAMEASRCWKLRNLWFGLKGRLGLGSRGGSS
jgi:SAM-dependent methyltransferase